jgi:integrase
MTNSNSVKISSRVSKGTAKIQKNGKYLRIQLPRTLYSGKQQYLNLGLIDTPENWSLAEAKLQEIQRDINYEEFDFSLDKYRPNSQSQANNTDASQAENLTFGEMLDAFEEKYFYKNRKNRKSQDTVSQYKSFIIRAFRLKENFDFYLTKEDIDEAIYSTEAGSRTRISTVVALQALFDCFKFQYEFESRITSGYQPKKRVLPNDAEIEDAWHKIKVESKGCHQEYIGNAESWGWIFAVIATYGLRPHEVLAIDYEKSFQDSEFSLHINEKITGGTKTGSRIVYPLPFEWVDFFDIANPKTKYLDESREILHAKIRTLADRFGERLKNKGINFNPYDLRHAYAIRGRKLGYESDDLARWMGHKLDEHTQTYQKYWDDEIHATVYKTELRRIEESEKIKNGGLSFSELEAELKKAESELVQLEAELNLRKSKPKSKQSLPLRKAGQNLDKEKNKIVAHQTSLFDLFPEVFTYPEDGAK